MTVHGHELRGFGDVANPALRFAHGVFLVVVVPRQTFRPPCLKHAFFRTHQFKRSLFGHSTCDACVPKGAGPHRAASTLGLLWRRMPNEAVGDVLVPNAPTDVLVHVTRPVLGGADHHRNPNVMAVEKGHKRRDFPILPRGC